MYKLTNIMEALISFRYYSTIPDNDKTVNNALLSMLCYVSKYGRLSYSYHIRSESYYCAYFKTN